MPLDEEKDKGVTETLQAAYCESERRDLTNLLNFCCYWVEWVQISGTIKPLRDDDASSVVEGEWRKLNTLHHYHVCKSTTK